MLTHMRQTIVLKSILACKLQAVKSYNCSSILPESIVRKNLQLNYTQWMRFLQKKSIDKYDTFYIKQNPLYFSRLCLASLQSINYSKRRFVIQIFLGFKIFKWNHMIRFLGIKGM